MFIWGNFPDNHYLKITRTRPGGWLILGPGSHGKSDWENWMRSTEVSWNRWNGLPWKILHVQLGCSIFNEPSSYVCDKGLAPWPYGNLAVSVSVSAENIDTKTPSHKGHPAEFLVVKKPQESPRRVFSSHPKRHPIGRHPRHFLRTIPIRSIHFIAIFCSW